MEEYLKDCPFCGQRAEIIGGLGEIWIVCKGCGAGQNMVSALDPDKLIQAWNTRVVDSDKQRLIEALTFTVGMIDPWDDDTKQRLEQIEELLAECRRER
jgi:hypothetical protein